jgi:hypothetical protein
MVICPMRLLPAPVTFTKRKPFRRNPILFHSNVLDVLLSRTRLTNLAILLLLFVCCMSLLLNAFHMNSTTRIHHQTNQLCTSSAMYATITREEAIRGLKHLIVVPGHAIWKGGDPQLRLDDNQWVLEPYQKSRGRVAAFFAHIQRG